MMAGRLLQSVQPMQAKSDLQEVSSPRVKGQATAHAEINLQINFINEASDHNTRQASTTAPLAFDPQEAS